MWSAIIQSTTARTIGLMLLMAIAVLSIGQPLAGQDKPQQRQRPIQKGILPPHISTDKTVKYDYPIVYVRAARDPSHMNEVTVGFSNVDHHGTPPGAELMLLRPDGREEVLVPVQPDEGVTDPFVSFDGEWVYYAKHHGVRYGGKDSLFKLQVSKGSDIFKVHVSTRKIVQLTHQEWTPNTGAVDPALKEREVYNLSPCPVPGGKVAFVSDRNGFRTAIHHGLKLAPQLFIMNDDGSNVELIGHLNLGGALHPAILSDGRIMFSSAETQGLRASGGQNYWALWSIHPDGTNWGPLASVFGDKAKHFHTQLSDGHIVYQEYYTLWRTFGTFRRFPVHRGDYPAFGSADPGDERNHFPGHRVRAEFTARGSETVTRFTDHGDTPPNTGWGHVTHPSGAPDNHLLLAWGGDTTPPGTKGEAFISSICLIKSGKPLDYPDEMLLIKRDPKYHAMWPRALAPYKRIHGIDAPPDLAAKKAKPSKHLPTGTPFGLVGTSSLYKRESYPHGAIPADKVTAVYSARNDGRSPDPFQGQHGFYTYTRNHSSNWTRQGAEDGLYGNEDVHAIRIVVTEPRTTKNQGGADGFLIHGSDSNERLRILGEFPVRRFQNGVQPVDPDGNADTSFLAKIPADMAWTFQTLDRHGMVLNMAQTWHQLRPGEVRHDCGGCHAHSQKPTSFELTKAARDDYPIWDLTGSKIPLLTTKQRDESAQQWDTANESGVRWEKGGVKSVEFYRDIRPILNRSCVACHSGKLEKPAGELVFDADEPAPADFETRFQGSPSGTWVRLAADPGGKFGHPSLVGRGHRTVQYLRTSGQVSRYVRVFQSRRSLLIWKVFGKRLDGWKNEDFAYETVPGDPNSLVYKGDSVKLGKNSDDPYLRLASPAYLGSIMPPPEAVAGAYVGPDGKKIKVEPLTDEDRLTMVRWVDLGCPIDLTYDVANPAKPKGPGGFMVDDNRPTLVLPSPQAGANPGAPGLTRILVGMYDYYTGLDMDSFAVVADFPVDGVPAGENLSTKFKALPDNRWELTLARPITDLPRGKLSVSIKDRQGNVTRIERSFSIRPE